MVTSDKIELLEGIAAQCEDIMRTARKLAEEGSDGATLDLLELRSRLNIIVSGD